ncbi:MAG: HAD-IB family hydrolase [Fibrobacter sp.]|nr:HAD-IB family hydrolase [Fibrobacter sp.]
MNTILGEKIGNIAVFNVDGTIAPTHSCTEFLLRTYGPVKYGSALFRAAKKHGFKMKSRDRIKLDLLSNIIKGEHADRFYKMAEKYSHLLQKKIDHRAAAKMHWHKKMGHQVILVSASLQAILSPLAKRLALDGVFSVELEEKGPILTGEVKNNVNMTGTEKVNAIFRFLGTKRIDRDNVNIWVYGDSWGDLKMLKMADHPYFVNLKRDPWIRDFREMRKNQ